MLMIELKWICACGSNELVTYESAIVQGENSVFANCSACGVEKSFSISECRIFDNSAPALKKIALISCTKLKQSHPCEAGDMYMPSQLFQKAKAYIESQGFDGWYILSAKFGLLHPKQVIETYNETLLEKSSTEVKAWSDHVHTKIKLQSPDVEEVHFFAGRSYRKFLMPLLEETGVVCRVPLQGLGIGQQLGWYTDRLRVKV